jgi:hypothetical protein
MATKYLAKFQSPTSVSWPKIIQPECISKLICNLGLYTFAMLCDIDLIFGMWVYSDKLQIKFTFRSGPIIFGRVMALGL